MVNMFLPYITRVFDKIVKWLASLTFFGVLDPPEEPHVYDPLPQHDVVDETRPHFRSDSQQPEMDQGYPGGVRFRVVQTGSKLWVTILDAQDLDPNLKVYIEVIVNNDKKQTGSKSGSENPNFGETFEFDPPPQDPEGGHPEPCLELKLMEKNFGFTDVVKGVIKLPFSLLDLSEKTQNCVFLSPEPEKSYWGKSLEAARLNLQNSAKASKINDLEFELVK